MTRQALLAIFAGLLSTTGWAVGGHYPVDDADIAPPGEFLVETWFTRFDGGNSEIAALPAYTIPDTSLELAAGLMRAEEDHERFAVFEPQAKYQLFPLEAGRVGLAVYAHAAYQDADNRWDETLVSVPLSYTMATSPVVVHVNAGWLRQYEEGWNDRLFLGGAFEWDAGERLGLIGQLYREGASAETEAQLGLRVEADGRIEHFDLALGRDLNGDGNWFFTAGLALTF